LQRKAWWLKLKHFLAKTLNHLIFAFARLLFLIVLNAVCDASDQYINILTEKQLSKQFTDTIIEKMKI